MPTIRFATAGALCLLIGLLDGAVICEVSAQPAPTVTTSQQGPLWRSLINLETHRLGEEFDEFAAGSPAPLSTPSPIRLTLPQAIANARARLTRDASAAAIAGLRNSPAAGSTRSLQGAAVAAVVSGKPSAALAAWLIAYDKEPRNPSVLVNLAGLLARIGMPTEALALLDAADATGASIAAPAGLKGQAVALNNRGYALLLLRRWKEADVALRKALALEPQLSEAARNLAFVLNQEGDREEARRMFFVGVWRVRPQTIVRSGAGSKPASPGAPPADPFQSKVTTRPALPELVDLSAGRRGKLPSLRHPTDVEEIVRFSAMTQRLVDECMARVTAASQRFGVVLGGLNTHPSAAKSLAERRSHNLSRLIPVDSEPDVKALLRIAMDAGTALTAEAYKINDSLKPAFREASNIKDANAKRARMMAIGNDGIRLITPAWNAFDDAQRKCFALSHWYTTAVAAQLGDPQWHEWAMLDAQTGANLAYVQLLHNSTFGYRIAAGQGVGAAMRQRSVEEPEALENEDSPCTGSATISIALTSAVSVSATCKSIGVEVGTEGWLGAFASVEYEFEGKVTVFAGPKAELGIEGLGTKVGMKDGLYITVDSKGIQDVGARVAFEGSTSAGPGVSVSTTYDSMDFSFMPSVPGK